MVQTQLAGRGISDPRVLAAFSKVPRHLFVPEPSRARSYTDHPLPIGEEQTISQPYIAALMTELLSPEAGSKVLEVGTGSGYQTAILAELSAAVYSMERIPSLAAGASGLLARLGYTNVRIRVGDGSEGWAEFAPFERILVAASVPAVPRSLTDQLALGGRLVIPVGSALNQTLTLVEHLPEGFRTEKACDCVFVPLIGMEGWEGGNAS